MRLSRLSLLATLLSVPAVGNSQDLSLKTESISVEGKNRTYAVLSASQGKSAPLVVVLHGLGGSGTQIVGDDGWASLADKEHFTVVGPNALTASGNERGGMQMWKTANSNSEDVKFIDALVDYALKAYNCDAKRVYVVGHSNGGGMTFRYAMSKSQRVAAIATMGSQELYGLQKPELPVPTLALMGELDPIIPPAGGRGKLGQVQVADAYYSKWAGLNGYSSTAKITQDDAIATVKSYGNDCQTWLIKGQGHGWPGGFKLKLPESLVGPSLNTIDATAEMWKFLSKHSR